MQPTLISLRGRILAMRIALIVIAAFALPGAVRGLAGCLGPRAAAPVARWTVVAPARIMRKDALRFRVRERVRQEVEAELGVIPSSMRRRPPHAPTRSINLAASNGAFVLMSLSK